MVIDGLGDMPVGCRRSWTLTRAWFAIYHGTQGELMKKPIRLTKRGASSIDDFIEDLAAPKKHCIRARVLTMFLRGYDTWTIQLHPAILVSNMTCHGVVVESLLDTPTLEGSTLAVCLRAIHIKSIT